MIKDEVNNNYSWTFEYFNLSGFTAEEQDSNCFMNLLW